MKYKIMKATIIIPARLGSTRLPGKLLKDIWGKTVIQRTIEGCQKVYNSKVIVVTEDQEIFDHIKEFVEVYITPHFETGTERIISVLDKIDTDIIINVQGDEPFVKYKDLERMIEILELTPDDKIIYTLDRVLNDSELLDRSCVKMYKQLWDEVAFFTRSPIFTCIGALKKHIGIYGFKKEYLYKIKDMEQTTNSKAESLEQITWMEKGASIYSIRVPSNYISIDTEDDLKKAREYARE